MDLSKGERKMNTTSNSLWVGYALLSAVFKQGGYKKYRPSF